jgi:hypothetical protein
MARDQRGVETEISRLAKSLRQVLLRLLTQPVPAAAHQGISEVDVILRSLQAVADRIGAVERIVADVHSIIQGQRFEKEWYTTGELAEILAKSRFTIQERWCNDGRIECEKDPDSGKWRIPGHEVRRLRAGGGLLPRQRRR